MNTKLGVSVFRGELAIYREGQGEPVIFLHGGPGDTHHYMKRMAEPLYRIGSKNQFQCIFFDQRGTGESKVESKLQEYFGMEVLLDDLDRVRRKITLGPVRLVGHSWGAMYGLYACMQTPENYSHAALLNMGPLDSEMERLTSEELNRSMGAKDNETWQNLRMRRNAARDLGDREIVEDCDRQMMRLRVKSWIFDPSLHDLFLKDYFQDPPPDREVNKLIWEAQASWFNWENVARAASKIWLLAGRHDSTPMAQFERLVSLLPNAELSVFEECGHVPWFEKPDLFYGELTRFAASRPDQLKS